MDPRIQRTKTKLRVALAVLLKEVSFERVSVSDLCRRSGISRITFYAYYDDKFALANELFDEMLQSGKVIFHKLQERNNPAEDPRRSCCNLLSAVLEMREKNRDLMAQLNLEDNSYLAFSHDWYVLRKAEECSRKYIEALRPAYPPQMTANLLCTGLWGFLRTGFEEQRDPEQVRAQAERMLDTLLNSSIFPSEETGVPVGGCGGEESIACV